MLPSLIVENFRILRALEIPALTQVNLITGTNNIGKSSLLESIQLYAARGARDVVQSILECRSEWNDVPDWTSERMHHQKVLTNYAGIFSGRQLQFDGQHGIRIGPIEYEDEQLSIIPVHYIEKQVSHDQGGLQISQEIVSEALPDAQTGFRFTYGNRSLITPLTYGSVPQIGDPETCHYCSSALAVELEVLWDAIVLTELETMVVEALQIIEPAIERITFGGDTQGRKALVKASHLTYPVPLRSMGRGINRVLSIVLGLVNSSDGYLLIDEFEDSLHYTMLENLWHMIFYLARRLNVQIFATTQSQDNIRAFVTAAESSENDDAGNLIRLELDNNQVSASCFHDESLYEVLEQQLEVR